MEKRTISLEGELSAEQQCKNKPNVRICKERSRE